MSEADKAAPKHKSEAMRRKPQQAKSEELLDGNALEDKEGSKFQFKNEGSPRKLIQTRTGKEAVSSSGEDPVDQRIGDMVIEEPRSNLPTDKRRRRRGQNKSKEAPSSSFWCGCPCVTLMTLLMVLFVLKFYMDNYHPTIEMYEKHFETLGVDSSATTSDIKKAYYKLSLKWHPDKNPGCGEECRLKFIEIDKAYLELTDPQLMQWYLQAKSKRITRENQEDFVPPEVDTKQPRKRGRSRSTE